MRAWWRTAQRRANIRSYGIEPNEYDWMFTTQGGVCAICRKPEIGKNLAIDHCHDKGHVRGLLCGSCNNGLGRFRHDPNLLLNAISYLRMSMKTEAVAQ